MKSDPMITDSDMLDISISCPIHHMEMGYTDFDSDRINHILTFNAKCELCLNNVIVKVKL